MNFFTKRGRVFTVAAAGVLILGLSCTAIASAGTRGGRNPVPFPSGNSLYDSLTVSSNYVWSMAYEATGIGQLGNDITLANNGGRLGQVVVSMANWNPASQSVPLQMTLNLYNPSVNEPGNGVAPGTLIGSDTITVTPPGTSTGSTWPSNPPTYGIDNFDVTFNFQSQNLTLPDDVVYDIAYNNTTIDTGLNVNLSYDSSSVPSAGADTYPGFLFVAIGNGANADAGGATGEITCQTVTTAFEQYSTQPTVYGSPACGLAAVPPGPGLLVPAVDFIGSY